LQITGRYKRKRKGICDRRQGGLGCCLAKGEKERQRKRKKKIKEIII